MPCNTSIRRDQFPHKLAVATTTAACLVQDGLCTVMDICMPHSPKLQNTEKQSSLQGNLTRSWLVHMLTQGVHMLTQGVHMLTQGAHMLTQGVRIECTSEAAETVVAVVATLTTAWSGGDKVIQDSIPSLQTVRVLLRLNALGMCRFCSVLTEHTAPLSS